MTTPKKPRAKTTATTEKAMPPNAGKGRKPGVQNKVTREVKQMILDALEAAGGKGGGVAYLTQQAKKNPKSFMTLVGKVLPLQITGQDGTALVVQLMKGDDKL